MITLITVLGSTVLISAIARLLGSSKKLAVLLAMIPSAIQGFLLSVGFITFIDSQGHKIPIWQMIAGGMVIPFILAVVVAALVKKKQPNQSPEATPGQRPPSEPSSSPGAPQL
jgi:predicted permease